MAWVVTIQSTGLLVTKEKGVWCKIGGETYIHIVILCVHGMYMSSHACTMQLRVDMVKGMLSQVKKKAGFQCYLRAKKSEQYK